MKIKTFLKMTPVIVLAGYLLLFFPGCNAIENLSNSGSKLIVNLITGTDIEGEPGSTTVFSDVLTTSGSIFNDTGTATLSAVLLDPTQTVGTVYQDVIVDQIDIVYTRADGLSIEGKDVPYAFSQKVSARVTIGEIFELGFVLVQHNAKLESPLVELVNLGQEHVLKMEAQVTFHAKDVAGNRLEPAVGSISVWFANFGDDN